MKTELPGWSDLPRTSALGLEIGPKRCGPECRSYHSVWGFLRLFGKLSAVSLDNDFMLSAISDGIRDGARRVLVSGSADHGILAYVLQAFDDAGLVPDVTIIDLCPTPLEICEFYAAETGHQITTEAVDALRFDAKPFDMIVAHNFLNFFSPEDRIQLVRRWSELLNDDGRVISLSTIKPGAPPISRRFNDADSKDLADRMAKVRAEGPYSELIEEEELRHLVLDYAERRASWNIENMEELSEPFEKAGLKVTLDIKENDRSHPRSSQKSKYRTGLVAKKA